MEKAIKSFLENHKSGRHIERIKYGSYIEVTVVIFGISVDIYFPTYINNFTIKLYKHKDPNNYSAAAYLNKESYYLVANISELAHKRSEVIKIIQTLFDLNKSILSINKDIDEKLNNIGGLKFDI